MTDRELDMTAAKAAGLTVVGDQHPPDGLNVVGEDGRVFVWRPRVDDGDALRLAVKLGLKVNVWGCAQVGGIGTFIECDSTATPTPATRRAIVRAAAAIGGLS